MYSMCLAIPGKIIEIKDDIATVDYGKEKRKAKIVEEGLKPILGSVKATPNPQDCTIVIETETDFLGSELAAKISEFFTGSGVRIEVPESGFEIVPC